MIHFYYHCLASGARTKRRGVVMGYICPQASESISNEVMWMLTLELRSNRSHLDCGYSRTGVTGDSHTHCESKRV